MALGIRDIRLGRLKLVSAHDDVSESVTAQLEAVGSAVLPGERQPRGMNISFPLYGADGDTDPYVQAARQRRQLRALLANRDAVMQGLYFAWVADPELNGWLVVGGGDISYEEGGVTLGDFKASLESVYKVGAQRTHRRGRRIELYDRRLSTTPRDYFRTVYSVDFAAQSALALNFLPVAVSDALGTGRSVLAPLNRAIRDGNLSYLVGQAHGTGVTFEQTEAEQNKGDVVVFDRRGFTAPTETLAGSSDPQGVYGWEEVYGPDQPLTAADVPVLDNGRVRVRYVAATASFAVDQWVGTGNGWSEQGRVTAWRWNGTTNHQYGGDLGAMTLRPDVLEWTPERAVVRVVFDHRDAANGARNRAEIIITLERGWTGPRFELYGSWSPAHHGGVAAPGVDFAFTSADAGTAVAWKPGATAPWFSTDGALGLGTSYTEPWVVLQPFTAGRPQITLSVLQAAIDTYGFNSSTAYGASRASVQVGKTGVGLAASYCSVTLGIGGRAAVYEAETYRVAGPTNSQVADGAASAGQTIQDTQTAETNITTAVVDAFGALGITAGKYLVLARVRLGTAGTQSVIARTVGGTSEATSIVTSTSTTYVWISVGELTVDEATDDLRVTTWRNTAGNSYLDRIVLVQLERRVAGAEGYDGARDMAQANLYDARSVPTLVER